MSAAEWTVAVGPVTTLLGVLGGYWMAGHNDEARDRRTAEREAASRRSEFQQKTLLQLQGELKQFVIATTALAIQKQGSPRNEEELQLVEKNTNEAIELNHSIGCLNERILDPSLREAVEILKRHCSKIDVGPIAKRQSEAELDEWMGAIPTLYSAVHELLGERLRTELAR
jgi:hypothetical protein